MHEDDEDDNQVSHFGWNTKNNNAHSSIIDKLEILSANSWDEDEDIDEKELERKHGDEVYNEKMKKYSEDKNVQESQNIVHGIALKQDNVYKSEVPYQQNISKQKQIPVMEHQHRTDEQKLSSAPTDHKVERHDEKIPQEFPTKHMNNELSNNRPHMNPPNSLQQIPNHSINNSQDKYKHIEALPKPSFSTSIPSHPIQSGSRRPNTDHDFMSSICDDEDETVAHETTPQRTSHDGSPVSNDDEVEHHDSSLHSNVLHSIDLTSPSKTKLSTSPSPPMEDRREIFKKKKSMSVSYLWTKMLHRKKRQYTGGVDHNHPSLDFQHDDQSSVTSNEPAAAHEEEEEEEEGIEPGGDKMSPTILPPKIDNDEADAGHKTEPVVKPKSFQMGSFVPKIFKRKNKSEQKDVELDSNLDRDHLNNELMGGAGGGGVHSRNQSISSDVQDLEGVPDASHLHSDAERGIQTSGIEPGESVAPSKLSGKEKKGVTSYWKKLIPNGLKTRSRGNSLQGSQGSPSVEEEPALRGDGKALLSDCNSVLMIDFVDQEALQRGLSKSEPITPDAAETMTTTTAPPTNTGTAATITTRGRSATTTTGIVTSTETVTFEDALSAPQSLSTGTKIDISTTTASNATTATSVGTSTSIGKSGTTTAATANTEITGRRSGTTTAPAVITATTQIATTTTTTTTTARGRSDATTAAAITTTTPSTSRLPIPYDPLQNERPSKIPLHGEPSFQRSMVEDPRSQSKEEATKPMALDRSQQSLLKQPAMESKERKDDGDGMGSGISLVSETGNGVDSKPSSLNGLGRRLMRMKPSKKDDEDTVPMGGDRNDCHAKDDPILLKEDPIQLKRSDPSIDPKADLKSLKDDPIKMKADPTPIKDDPIYPKGDPMDTDTTSIPAESSTTETRHKLDPFTESPVPMDQSVDQSKVKSRFPSPFTLFRRSKKDVTDHDAPDPSRNPPDPSTPRMSSCIIPTSSSPLRNSSSSSVHPNRLQLWTQRTKDPLHPLNNGKGLALKLRMMVTGSEVESNPELPPAILDGMEDKNLKLQKLLEKSSKMSSQMGSDEKGPSVRMTSTRHGISMEEALHRDMKQIELKQKQLQPIGSLIHEEVDQEGKNRKGKYSEVQRQDIEVNWQSLQQDNRNLSILIEEQMKIKDALNQWKSETNPLDHMDQEVIIQEGMNKRSPFQQYYEKLRQILRTIAMDSKMDSENPLEISSIIPMETEYESQSGILFQSYLTKKSLKTKRWINRKFIIMLLPPEAGRGPIGRYIYPRPDEEDRYRILLREYRRDVKAEWGIVPLEWKRDYWIDDIVAIRTMSHKSSDRCEFQMVVKMKSEEDPRGGVYQTGQDMDQFMDQEEKSSTVDEEDEQKDGEESMDQSLPQAAVRRKESMDQPRPQSIREEVSMDQPRPKSVRKEGSVDQFGPQSASKQVSMDQPRPQSIRKEVSMDLTRSKSDKTVRQEESMDHTISLQNARPVAWMEDDKFLQFIYSRGSSTPSNIMNPSPNTKPFDRPTLQKQFQTDYQVLVLKAVSPLERLVWTNFILKIATRPIYDAVMTK